MSRAQPKSSPTDEHARRIAHAIAKGRPPPFSAALDRYCESSPHEIFAAFMGAARHMPPAGEDEALAIGYLFLLQRLLEHLRYRIDRGYADAARLIAEFQADVVAQVEAGHVDGRMLAFLGGALRQSKIPASPELAAASTQHPVDQSEGGSLPSDVRAALAGIFEACGGDPFIAAGALIEQGHALPLEARTALASALTFAGTPELRGAAVLFLLGHFPSFTPSGRLASVMKSDAGNPRTQEIAAAGAKARRPISTPVDDHRVGRNRGLRAARLLPRHAGCGRLPDRWVLSVLLASSA